MKDAAFRQLYPFASNFHAIDGHRYHYVDAGAGEPVVMLHGNPTWSFFYRDLIQSLCSQYRCLAPDHMGCGFSDKPADYPYTLTQHIANLESWLEATLPPAQSPGGKINLIVHDWGGPIGMGYAVRRPERINRVVILNTSAFTAGQMPFCIRLCRVPGLGAALVRGANAFAGGAARFTTTKPLPKAVRRGFVRPYDSWARRVAVHRFVQDIPLVAGTPTHSQFVRTETELAEALAGKPMLIQWGMRDWCFTPFFLALWRQRFPNAEVDEYPEAGHYLLEDAGARITARIRTFLEKNT